MKNLSAISALMILLFVSLACSDSGGTTTASSDKPADENTTQAKQEKTESDESGVYVEWLKLYTDDGSGDEGDEVTGFKPTDNPQHFVAHLSEFEGGTKVKFVFTAINAGGEKNYKIKELEQETNSLVNQVTCSFKLPRPFPTGDYKVDVYVNGKLSKTVKYKIKE
jgi:uncharacterized OB-fold protein